VSSERVQGGSKTDTYIRQTSLATSAASYSVLGRLRNLKDGETFTDVEIASECSDHLSAGIDTTGDALCFLLWHLSQSGSKPMQDRLYSELRSHAELNPAAFVAADVPYLDAMLKESLRCFPPIPMSLPRYVPAGGRTIEGVFVPAGTIVSCQAWTLHQLDTTVFPNPEEFRPERWLETEGGLERNRLFFAFATGGRGCIGKK
jgi:cytochrome P450